MSTVEAVASGAGFRDYLRLARFDHATKHVFILPGIVLALLLRGGDYSALYFTVVLGFASAVAIASANYVINEWLDRGFDVFHPEKWRRVAVQKTLNPTLVYQQYFVLFAVGLGLASLVNTSFLLISILFLLAGIVYNVPPIRSKDRAYLDVISESFNNPIRLSLGWAMVDSTTLPPVSLLLAFWFGGAFLMNSKRLAEYRDIVAADGAESLARYRRAFASYTEARLSVANLIYALLCSFFAAIFLIKYRIEYIILFPFMTALFAVYYMLSLKPNSVARKPELLFKSRALMIIVAATVAAFLFATVVDMPALARLTDQHFIHLRGHVVD